MWERRESETVEISPRTPFVRSRRSCRSARSRVKYWYNVRTVGRRPKQGSGVLMRTFQKRSNSPASQSLPGPCFGGGLGCAPPWSGGVLLCCARPRDRAATPPVQTCCALYSSPSAHRAGQRPPPAGSGSAPVTRCTDDPAYLDIYSCRGWVGYNCANGGWGVDGAERIALLLASCPVACLDGSPNCS